MKSLIVLHGPFNCNSGIQVFHLANRLCQRGWDVAVAAPSPTEDVRDVGDPQFECLTYAEARRTARRWAGQDLVIHAWTPREGVRRLTEELVRSAGAPYVVHLEDNEEHLASVSAKMPFPVLRALPSWAQSLLARDWRIHPTRYSRFLAHAAGITMVTQKLNEFNVAGRPHAVVRPVVDTDEFAPSPDGRARRRELGLRPEDFVLVYHGNSHPANRGDVKTLYLAVRLLRDRGHPVRLIRLGQRDAWSERVLRPPRAGVIELGVRPRAEVVTYLGMADAFVQPGASDDFNAYRFPSKIPEFLAMGRPVVLPECNVGLELVDGENALLLREGSAQEIAAKVELLVGDRQLARHLGEGAREFAVRRLSPSQGAATLSEFLARVISDWRDSASTIALRAEEQSAAGERAALASRDL